MSIHIMTKVFNFEARNHTEKLVMLALADNANDEGECWPSLATLSRKCQLTKPGLLNVIAKMAERDLVTRTSGGGRYTNRYQFGNQFLPESTVQTTREPAPRTVENNPETGKRRLPPPVNGVYPTGKPGLPQGSMAFTPPVNGVYPNHKGTVKEPSGNRGKAPPESPSTEVREAVAAYALAFSKQFHRTYGVTRADASAARMILSFADVHPSDIGKVAQEGWSCGGWCGRRATSLSLLAKNWNEVQAEIATGQKPNGTTVIVPEWAEGWADDLMAK